jgi:hypothetical protein
MLIPLPVLTHFYSSRCGIGTGEIISQVRFSAETWPVDQEKDCSSDDSPTGMFANGKALEKRYSIDNLRRKQTG